MFSAALEIVLTIAHREATSRRHAHLTLEHLARVEVESVSAGDISRDGRWILLRREDTGWLFERRDDEPIATALGRKPKKVPVRGDGQKKNGEAIAFHPDSSGYFTISEGKRQPIVFFPMQ